MGMKKLALLLTSSLCLAACSSGTDGKAPPDLTFQHVVPVNLPVSDVAIERASGYNTGNNATSFIVPFEEKVDAYIRRKIQTVGGDKRLRVIVEQATVKQSFEPSTNTVAGFLEVAGFDVYQIGLIMNVMAVDPYGGNKGVRLKLGRTVKISEHASVAERERKQTESVESLFKELDTNMTRITLQELGLIPYQGGSYQQGGMAPSSPYSGGYDSGYGGGTYNAAPSYGGGYDSGAPAQHPRVITGGPSTGGGYSSGASTGAIERQGL